MSVFRTRIGKVTHKESGFQVINLPEYDGEVSPMLSSYMDESEDLVDNLPEMNGYVIMAFSERRAIVVVRHAKEVAQHQFLIMCEHVLRNFERYDNTAGDKETP